MLRYDPALKERARYLRTQMTGSEQELWSMLRLKQVLGVQFYRQKPIGDYIVDFYAPRVRLVVEVDGSQHLTPNHVQRDAQRDAYLAGLGLKVLRFSNSQVLKELDAVVEVIFHTVLECGGGNPPNPPFEKGGYRGMWYSQVWSFRQGSVRLNQSQGGNYILQRWQRHGRCKHQCVGSGL